MEAVKASLWINCGVQGVILLGASFIAFRRGLIHWRSTTFWALSAFTLYFFVHPFVALLSDSMGRYYEMLAHAGGARRVDWITLVVACGMVAFFIGNLRARPKRVGVGNPNRWPYPSEWPPGTLIVIGLALVGATYSLIVHRGAFGLESAVRGIEEGAFVGEYSAYSVTLHRVALFPLALLLLTPRTVWWGRAAVVVYIGARLFDPWDRTTVLTLFVIVSMTPMFLRDRGKAPKGRRWPSWAWVPVIVAAALILQIRSHRRIDHWLEGENVAIQGIDAVLAAGDSSMLSGFYLESHLNERRGFTYGADLVGKLALGALPRRLFPWKDDYHDWFGLESKRYVSGEQYMLTRKSSVMQTFYSWAGLPTVMIFMFLLGWLTTRIEHLASGRAARPVAALGITWLSFFWMMLGSNLYWCLGYLFFSGLPAFALFALHWLSAPRKQQLVARTG